MPEHRGRDDDEDDNQRQEGDSSLLQEKYLGREEYYPDFLRFFQLEMKKAKEKERVPGGGEGMGAWQRVVSDYLLDRDKGADALLVRLYAGFLHPLIQLMYGVEW